MCEKCKKSFELIMAISEREKGEVKCPKCRGTKGRVAVRWRGRLAEVRLGHVDDHDRRATAGRIFEQRAEQERVGLTAGPDAAR
jgi:DNA-directed RNA polymerase subunit RPC12/RpoP